MKKFLPTSTAIRKRLALSPSVNSGSKGFTLVELLVVISIIAILSMIGMVMYTGVQKNARDAKRKEDVQAIQKALESHYNDTACGADPTNALPYCKVTGNGDKLFSSGSIPSYPPHPTVPAASYTYPLVASTANSTYTVCARLENSTGNYDLVSGVYTPNPTNTGTFYCLNNQQ